MLKRLKGIKFIVLPEVRLRARFSMIMIKHAKYLMIEIEKKEEEEKELGELLFAGVRVNCRIDGFNFHGFIHMYASI